MAQAWEPQAASLQELVNLFRAYSDPTTDNSRHRQIQQQLIDFNRIPEFNNYLVYIFTCLSQEDVHIRQRAGLALKNNVSKYWEAMAPAFQQSVPAPSNSRRPGNTTVARCLLLAGVTLGRAEPCARRRYVRERVLGAIIAPEQQIRRTASQCISEIARTTLMAGSWPDLLPTLAQASVPARPAPSQRCR